MATQLSELETQLEDLRTEGTDAIATSQTLEELEQLRINYLGKKGKVSVVLGGMGKLDPSERPRIGALANDVKKALEVGTERV